MIRPLRMRSRPIASQLLMKRRSVAGSRPSSENKQDAGVEIGLAERAGQRAAFLVPGLGENRARKGRVRLVAQYLRPVGDVEPPGDPASRSHAAQHSVAE